MDVMKLMIREEGFESLIRGRGISFVNNTDDIQVNLSRFGYSAMIEILDNALEMKMVSEEDSYFHIRLYKNRSHLLYLTPPMFRQLINGGEVMFIGDDGMIVLQLEGSLRVSTMLDLTRKAKSFYQNLDVRYNTHGLRLVEFEK